MCYCSPCRYDRQVWEICHLLHAKVAQTGGTLGDQVVVDQEGLLVRFRSNTDLEGLMRSHL
jgi:hypothetical protein